MPLYGPHNYQIISGPTLSMYNSLNGHAVGEDADDMASLPRSGHRGMGELSFTSEEQAPGVMCRCRGLSTSVKGVPGAM